MRVQSYWVAKEAQVYKCSLIERTRTLNSCSLANFARLTMRCRCVRDLFWRREGNRVGEKDGRHTEWIESRRATEHWSQPPDNCNVVRTWRTVMSSTRAPFSLVYFLTNKVCSLFVVDTRHYVCVFYWVVITTRASTRIIFYFWIRTLNMLKQTSGTDSCWWRKWIHRKERKRQERKILMCIGWCVSVNEPKQRRKGWKF